MMGRSHATIGASAGGSLALALHVPALALPCALVGAIGGLLPDLDQLGSTIARSCGPLTGALAHLVHLAAGGHRALTHWPLAWAGVGLALGLGVAPAEPGGAGLAHTLVLAGCLAYGLHLLADALTVSGIPGLRPFRGRRLHAAPPGLRIETGSPAETIIVAVCLTAIAALWVTLWRPEALAVAGASAAWLGDALHTRSLR